MLLHRNVLYSRWMLLCTHCKTGGKYSLHIQCKRMNGARKPIYDIRYKVRYLHGEMALRVISKYCHMKTKICVHMHFNISSVPCDESNDNDSLWLKRKIELNYSENIMIIEWEKGLSEKRKGWGERERESERYRETIHKDTHTHSLNKRLEKLRWI